MGGGGGIRGSTFKRVKGGSVRTRAGTPAGRARTTAGIAGSFAARARRVNRLANR